MKFAAIIEYSQDKANAHLKGQEGEINIHRLTDTPVAEGKGNAECQDEPEAPMQVDAEPAEYEGLQIGAQQDKRVGYADCYGD